MQQQSMTGIGSARLRHHPLLPKIEGSGIAVERPSPRVHNRAAKEARRLARLGGSQSGGPQSGGPMRFGTRREKVPKDGVKAVSRSFMLSRFVWQKCKVRLGQHAVRRHEAVHQSPGRE
jgi:hypothetical protein